ncbi:hypothetical protein PaG_03634 [Moesziomyces aphidis]|uniref:Nitrogen permease regulator 3 n=1 Tax=Moesziomyces aphidis TaxID=84754 RepID=W3VMS6_MOEAP|nr:hypothetical protein PaG_03634 [Moesziomyces aphidis]
MAEPLLGVILATSSSRGDHVVFRWPNNPKIFKRYSKVKYYTESRPSGRPLPDDDLDPVRQKAKWDRHDEDDDDHAHSDDAGQSDTPSSSDIEDSDASLADDDENRSVRDRAETVASHGRCGPAAAPSTNRSKSKPRRPLVGLEESTPSVRSADRHNAKDTQDANDRAPDSDAGTSKELSPEEKARREEKAAMAYKTYLGYDIEILASILNPRPELAHQKFELIVDDLAFLGHPVAASKAGTWGEPDNHDGHPGATDSDDAHAAAPSQRRGRSGLRKEIRPYDVPDGHTPAKEHDADSAKKGKSEPKTSDTEAPASKAAAPLTQFHLVLVLDRPDPSTAMSGMDLSSWLQLFYDNIVFKMTAALFAEQSKSDYVGRETEKLLALRERCMDDGQAYSAYAAQCLGVSSLARCIRDLHKSISTSSDAFLTINDRIEVHLQLPPILQDPVNLPKTVDIETELDPNDPIFLSGGGFAGLGKEGADEDGGGGTYDRLLELAPHQLSFEEWCRTTGPYLLPWKTLLLLHDQPDEAARGRRTPGSASPAGHLTPAEQAPETHGFEQLARNFTSLFRPDLMHSLNFSEVADMLGWDLYEDVYPMVRHLIYYRQARVIDIPRPGHVYAISPLFDFGRLGALSRVWAHTFPELAPLPVFLSQLSSSSRALSALFPGRHQRELALEVLIWLLRRDVVVKMHIRLRLFATEAVKRRTAERGAERHERHRAQKQRKREKLARIEARRMKRSQAAEQQKRKKAEQAQRTETHDKHEHRGRSRERDRSRSVDARQQKQHDAAGDDLSAAASHMSVSRPSVLADPDSVAEAAALAAAIAGSDMHAALPPSGDADASHSQDHRHAHHHHHHHHRHRHGLVHKDAAGASETSGAGAGASGAIPIGSGAPLDELKFERRPVLRSRSPSTAAPGLSVSFSTLSERGELIRRARADTSASSSSGGARARGDGLSMTPTASQQSRPTTPSILTGPRNVPAHVRDRSVSAVSSSAEGSMPRRARGLSGRKIARSRSPSRARMRVRGFGLGAEVEIDEENDDDTTSAIKVVEEPRRRISTASERPELPPPSETDHSSHCSCSSCDSSSASDLSLSSDSDSDSQYAPSRAVDEYTESLIVEPARASRRENDYIATMVADKDPATVKNFFRLLPYLNGKHSIDEIEYRVKMRRRDIRRLLAVFREYIITFMHP